MGIDQGILPAHLKDEEDIELETEPDRELTEEFFETIKVKLNPGQYTVQPQGFVIENNPVRSENAEARGQLTVHSTGSTKCRSWTRPSAGYC